MTKYTLGCTCSSCSYETDVYRLSLRNDEEFICPKCGNKLEITDFFTEEYEKELKKKEK